MDIRIAAIWGVHALVTLGVFLFCKRRLLTIRNEELQDAERRLQRCREQGQAADDVPAPTGALADLEEAEKRAAIVASARQSRDLVLLATLFLSALIVAMVLQTVIVLDWAAPVVVVPDPAASPPADPAPSPAPPAKAGFTRQAEPVRRTAPYLAGAGGGPSAPQVGDRTASAVALEFAGEASAIRMDEHKQKSPVEPSFVPNRPGISANWWEDVRLPVRLVQTDGGCPEGAPGFPVEVTLVYEALYRHVVRYVVIGLGLTVIGGTIYWLLFWRLAAAERRDPLGPREHCGLRMHS